jgi:NAD(P)H-dependent FMN reductase
MAKPKIGIIIGSVRPNRFADHPAQWILELAKARDDIEVEFIDLRDFPMPLFAEKMSPAYGPPENEVARRFGARIAEFDGYVFITAEYNRGPTAVLKNALDYTYKEWNGKAVGFVGYGGVGGARAVEQLRLNAIELQMAPIRVGVHIQVGPYLEVLKGEKKLSDYDFLNQSGKEMLDQLVWWTTALKTARDEPTRMAA